MRYRMQVPADYHPNSNDIVRDYIHPALYSYVHGLTSVVPSNDFPAAALGDYGKG